MFRFSRYIFVLYMYIYILKLVYMLYSYFISEKSIDQNVLIGFLVSLCSIALSKAHRTVPNCNTEGNMLWSFEGSNIRYMFFKIKFDIKLYFCFHLIISSISLIMVYGGILLHPACEINYLKL